MGAMTNSSGSSVLAMPLAEATPFRSPWRDLLRRLLRNPLSVLGFAIIAGAVLCAILAPVITPYSPVKGDLINAYLKLPSAVHLFGTDELGRDIFSRIIYGAQISLAIGLGAEALGLAIGTTLGLLAGYIGGWVDTLIMRLVDILMAFPVLIIAIALAAALGRSDLNLVFALALSIWPLPARLARGQVLSIKELDYVAAARLIGIPNWGIMRRHILPNILAPLIVYGTLGAASVILQEATLSFLGLGATNQFAPSWGNMLADAQAYTLSAPWLSFFPGMAILLVVLGLNLLGDGLRDALDVLTD